MNDLALRIQDFIPAFRAEGVEASIRRNSHTNEVTPAMPVMPGVVDIALDAFRVSLAEAFPQGKAFTVDQVADALVQRAALVAQSLPFEGDNRRVADATLVSFVHYATYKFDLWVEFNTPDLYAPLTA